MQFLQFVVAAGDGIYRGSQGQMQWQKLPTPPEPAGTLYWDRVISDGALSIVAKTGHFAQHAKMCVYSTDGGDSWQQFDPGLFGITYVMDIAYCNGKFFCITFFGVIYELDLQSGSATEIFNTGLLDRHRLFDVACNGGSHYVVLLGGSGIAPYITRSSNGGATWETPAAITGGGSRSGVHFAEGVFWLTHTGKASEYSTDNGATWTPITVAPEMTVRPPGISSVNVGQSMSSEPLIRCAFEVGSRLCLVSEFDQVFTTLNRTITTCHIYFSTSAGQIKYFSDTVSPFEDVYYNRNAYMYDYIYEPDAIPGQFATYDTGLETMNPYYHFGAPKLLRFGLYAPEIGCVHVGPYGGLSSWHFGEANPINGDAGVEQRTHMMWPRSNCPKLADIAVIRTPWMPRAKVGAYGTSYRDVFNY